MKIIYLDVIGTHVGNSDCPMRIAKHPNGSYWCCIDCGLPIIYSSVDVIDKATFNKIKEEIIEEE